MAPTGKKRKRKETILRNKSQASLAGFCSSWLLTTPRSAALKFFNFHTPCVATGQQWEEFSKLIFHNSSTMTHWKMNASEPRHMLLLLEDLCRPKLFYGKPALLQDAARALVSSRKPSWVLCPSPTQISFCSPLPSYYSLSSIVPAHISVSPSIP